MSFHQPSRRITGSAKASTGRQGGGGQAGLGQVEQQLPFVLGDRPFFEAAGAADAAATTRSPADHSTHRSAGRSRTSRKA